MLVPAHVLSIQGNTYTGVLRHLAALVLVRYEVNINNRRQPTVTVNVSN